MRPRPAHSAASARAPDAAIPGSARNLIEGSLDPLHTRAALHAAENLGLREEAPMDRQGIEDRMQAIIGGVGPLRS